MEGRGEGPRGGAEGRGRGRGAEGRRPPPVMQHDLTFTHIGLPSSRARRTSFFPLVLDLKRRQLKIITIPRYFHNRANSSQGA